MTPEFHPVSEGETLGEIAKRYRTSVRRLCEINGIANPNKIAEGQRIYLKARPVQKAVGAVVLDRQRNPIEGLRYQLHVDGKVISGVTGANGMIDSINLPSAAESVTLYFERLDKSMKEICTVIAREGRKLVTLISPRVRIDGKTAPHREVPSNQEKVEPAFDSKGQKPPTGAVGTQTTAGTTPAGNPLTVVQGEVPSWDFVDKYSGESMEEADYVWAANELKVELAAIKAFAVVESGSSGFAKIGDRMLPKILYERHKFSKLTKHQYSTQYPDISLPTPYYNAKAKYVVATSEYKKQNGIPESVQYYRPLSKKDSAETKKTAVTLSEMLKSGAATADRDKYLSGEGSYRRLLKAYQLDQDAALESCSWGAFQIMGEYWKAMGYASAKEFTRAQSRSPKEQIKAFVRYIKFVNPVIRKHLANLDWDAAARAYNGPGYKDNAYDEKLEAAYDKFKASK